MWLEGEDNYKDWKDNITMLLGSKGLAKFIKKESTIAQSDEVDCQRIVYTITIKGSMHPEPAIGLKGVTDPAEIIHLLN
jgi:hypothetical protein